MHIFVFDSVVQYDPEMFLTGVVKFTHLQVLSILDKNMICRSQYAGNSHASTVM